MLPFRSGPPFQKAALHDRQNLCSLLGLDAILVEVEVDLASGFPGFATVGLPGDIVREGEVMSPVGRPARIRRLPLNRSNSACFHFALTGKRLQ